jgi:nicotinamide-nucleotide amidase
MRIEILCTGDELLNGTIADTNSPFFMSRLFDLGGTVARTTVVGDVREEIVSALREVSGRAELVLVSGGLGPTSDDLTAECAAEVAGVPLVEDARALEAIRARFARRNLEVTPNNARQARVPRGAEVVLNPVGSAPMFIVTLGRCTLFFLPGVPREYRALVEREVLPRVDALLARRPGRMARATRVLKTVGLAESHLDARVEPIAARHPRIRVGYRTHAPENHLKLIAEAPTPEEAGAALAAVERECRAALGDHVFGADGDELAAVVGARLRERRETLAVAEAYTGGLLCQLLTGVAGAADYLRAGRVVPAGSDAVSSGASEEVACQMAGGVRAQAGATWGVAITGEIGPEGHAARDEVGTIFCAVAGEGRSLAERHAFAGDLDRIRRFAAHAAMDLLRRTLR